MYKKTYKTKIIRTEHEITIYSNSRAVDIKKSLNQVPDEAKIIGVSGSFPEDFSQELSNIECILTFLEEQRENNEKHAPTSKTKTGG